MTPLDNYVAPGRVLRSCPVCRRAVYTVREPGTGREMVHYAGHADGIGKPCAMGGKRAALRAVAFTGVAA